MNYDLQTITVLALVWLGTVQATDPEDRQSVKDKGTQISRNGSAPGPNAWNQAEEPSDWWNEIKRLHGHVGPWNVLGWRIGKAALRELGVGWGLHEVDVICHIPLEMPYSCLYDGLVIGTGNSGGRLDLRMAEVMTLDEIHVSVCRKIGRSEVVLLKPNHLLLEKLLGRPTAELEGLSRACAEQPESQLFEIERRSKFKSSGSR